MAVPFYVSVLIRELEKRKKRNSKYSLRSYAKLLGIHSSSLSSILKKKRTFPVHRVESVVRSLKLSDAETDLFYQSVIQERFLISPQRSKKSISEKSTSVLNDELHFHILSQWEYYAVLTLLDTKSFRPEFSYIARRLGISASRAREVWGGLKAAGLIVQDANQNWKASSESFSTSEDISSPALRMGHLEELHLGMKKIHSVPVLERDYSSSIIAIPKANIVKAKKLIRQFRKDFSQLVEGRSADEVYLLAIQFFPLTEK